MFHEEAKRSIIAALEVILARVIEDDGWKCYVMLHVVKYEIFVMLGFQHKYRKRLVALQSLTQVYNPTKIPKGINRQDQAARVEKGGIFKLLNFVGIDHKNPSSPF